MPAPSLKAPSPRRIVFAGGGTGGHLYPAIALADALRERNAAVAFVGTADRLEATIVPKAGYELHTIASRPLVRKLSWDFLRTVVANAAGTAQSFALLLRLRPDLVIATGGYVCFPAVLAARALQALGVFRMAIALLEPNAKPGLTNRLLAPLVDEVWGAFGDADSRFAGKYVRTGVPVRSALRSLPSRGAAIAGLGLDPGRKTLLAIGGSQGARTINDALCVLTKEGGLLPGWQLIVVTGARDFDRVRAEMESRGVAVRPYLDDLSQAYAAADLVLARAGASTLAELAAVGKPAILVPYPFAADDHQTSNAERFAATGAGVIVADGELQSGALRNAIAEATASPRIDGMRADAERLRSGDPVATILARVDWLLARK
jgi:UDP-N-acetylglucosamine--N-acetylmuramyl-(pentapeptide) pyrophosphoryl-undecaprenol N-acetylglucosamine transferase